jgi:aryl-alcohol dehydrogenase-like predicted oxidoreductase
MQKVTLGRTGLLVSRLALGGYPFGGLNRARDWDPWSSDGQRTAITTINHAIDSGINYIDTAPSYGGGQSELLIGEVMRTRRQECVLATKVGWDQHDKDAVIKSVQASLKRLQTDYIDLVQFHGGAFTPQQSEHIINGGPLDALLELQRAGQIGFIGLTAEEAWTALKFVSHQAFSVFQLAYNVIYQSAAKHILDDARRADAGIVTMRTMTSGVFQRMAGYLAPKWQDAHDLYEVCLKFVLSDSRVHAAIVGMRWPEEVDRNVTLLDGFRPAFDLAQLPRMTADIYNAEDSEQAATPH